jgi:hypothetical protein
MYTLNFQGNSRDPPPNQDLINLIGVLDNIGIWKQGLVVEGIEIRPKEGNYTSKLVSFDAFRCVDEEIIL